LGAHTSDRALEERFSYTDSEVLGMQIKTHNLCDLQRVEVVVFGRLCEREPDDTVRDLRDPRPETFRTN